MGGDLVLIAAAVLMAGVISQWLGWKLAIPPIVFLLTIGLVAGPVSGVLDPDEAFGDVLFPTVSIAVAVILFEGSLGLGMRGLRLAGNTVWRLLTIGVAVSLVGITAAAILVLDVDRNIAVLIATVLVVTGPTVIGPIVTAIGLSGRVGAILESEGTLIDPIGAILTVLAFEGLFGSNSGLGGIVVDVLLTLGVGSGIGLVAAILVVIAMDRFFVPDHLLNVSTLAVVVAAFAISNQLREESGLVAVTVLGIALATQSRVPVHRVLEFNETLRILFISGLFVLLGARIAPETLRSMEWRNFLFLLILVSVVRPLGVLASTIGSKVTRNERIYLALTAPRGIVAASVASVFSLRLEELGIADAQVLVSVVFTVIAGTVLMSGLISKPLGVRLGLIQAERRTVIVLGANQVAQMFAEALSKNGVPTQLIDVNGTDLTRARMTGLATQRGSVISESTWEGAGLDSAAAFVAMSQSDEVNALASHRAIETLGRKNAFQLAPSRPEHQGDGNAPTGAFARTLFSDAATYAELDERLREGWRTASTRMTEIFDKAQHAQVHPKSIPMFIIDADGHLHILGAERKREPRPGDTLVTLTATTDEVLEVG